MVPVEARQVPDDPQPEPVPGPLEHALLVLDPARQRHVGPLNGGLVRRLAEEDLGLGSAGAIGGQGGLGRGRRRGLQGAKEKEKEAERRKHLVTTARHCFCLRHDLIFYLKIAPAVHVPMRAFFCLSSSFFFFSIDLL